MPERLHDRADAKELFETLAAKKGLLPVLVEKDYWIMHCLWGLGRQGFAFELKGGTSLSKGWGIVQRFSEDIDVRFDPPQGLNVKDGKKEADVEARLSFFDGLAAKVDIPGVTAERDRVFDDEKALNGGISLMYRSHFGSIPQVKAEVLLEVGFARTAPNEPRDVSSWALEAALEAGLDVVDNRARAVKCFTPEYTFVDKLQTIARRYRQNKARGSERDRPREFLRHYYDLYMLLGEKRVQDFIGTAEYDRYKAEKLKGEDAKAFGTREPFTLPDAGSFALLEREFEAMDTLLLGKGPAFKDVVGRFREYAARF